MMSLHNGGKVLWAAVAVCLLSIAFFGGSLLLRIHDQDRIDRVAMTTHDALCTFKLDLQRRANDTAVFIAELEHGQRPMIPGITAADLKRSLVNQRATIESLSDLDCG